MNFHIETDIKVSNILKSRGLGNNHAAWLYAAERFKFYCGDYVPMDTGTLKNTAVVAADSNGASVSWVQPYAHYQYTGLVMGPNTLTPNGWRSFHTPKYYTGAALSYSAGRGSKWDKKMLAAKRLTWLQDVANYVGGTVK